MTVRRSGKKASEILRGQVRALERGLERSGALAVGSVKVLINRGNADGKSPSLPGEPPKKVSGRLFQSINYKVQKLPGRIIVKIGTNVEYARRLELGFFGTDSAGRKIQQAPRPFLVPGVRRKKAEISRLVKNSFKRGR